MEFLCSGNGKITIGDRCDIAPQVTIVTGSHEIGDSEQRAGVGKNENVIIGNGCWVCARATIIGGVNISDSCIIASCACVISSFDSNNMVGGVPARKIADLSK
jgi:maltose O-acetyltransferase